LQVGEDLSWKGGPPVGTDPQSRTSGKFNAMHPMPRSPEAGASAERQAWPSGASDPTDYQSIIETISINERTSRVVCAHGHILASI